MLPLGDRVTVRREGGEQVLPSGLVVPAPDLRHAHIGCVTARGRDAHLEIGTRIIYSSRVDVFTLEDGSDIDVVEGNSVIGVMQ